MQIIKICNYNGKYLCKNKPKIFSKYCQIHKKKNILLNKIKYIILKLRRK